MTDVQALLQLATNLHEVANAINRFTGIFAGAMLLFVAVLAIRK